MSQQSEVLVLRGTLEGHNGWVTALATAPLNPNVLISASRDKTLIVWDLTRDEENYGVPRRSLHGHSHIVQDVAITVDGNYAISGSWDKTVRLWNLETGESAGRFAGHTKDVLSVAFSSDSRQIFSAGRDRTINMWNVNGELIDTLERKSHTDWISAVRYAPAKHPFIVSAGWDKVVKVWDINQPQLNCDLIGHTGYISTITVSPDGSLCASGGKDGMIILWNLNDRTHLYTLSSGDEVHSLAFSPNRYWLCAATTHSIKIYDLEKQELIEELRPDATIQGSKSKEPEPISLAWASDGQSLFAGYTDNLIRVWQVMRSS